MNRLPVVDQDGRLWIWRLGQGYMPEDMNQYNSRINSLKNNRIKRDKTNRRTNLNNKLFAASDGYCCICGYKINNNNIVSQDHVLPRSKGGNDYNNIVPSHAKCNNRKGNRMPFGCELIWLDIVNIKLGDLNAA